MNCAKCGKANADKRCAKCYAVAYCSKDCQRDHWKAHKKECATLANQKHADKDDKGPSASGATPKEPTLATPAPAIQQARPPPAAAQAATATNARAAASNAKIPSRPYELPANASAHAKTLYAKLKPLLDVQPEHVPQALANSEFCLEKDGDSHRIDTTVVYMMHELLQETAAADPMAACEAFKRMIGIKMFVKHSDHLLFARARIRMEVTAKMMAELRASGAPPPPAPPPMPAEFAQLITACRSDAASFLQLSLKFLDDTEAAVPQAGRPAPAPGSLLRMRKLNMAALGYCVRHMPNSKDKSKELLTSACDVDSSDAAMAPVVGFAAYGLAADACARGDSAEFSKRLDQSEAAWKRVNNAQLLQFIAQHKQQGVCEACAAQMARVMDGNEVMFGAQTSHALPKPRGATNGAAAADAAAASGDGGSTKGSGLKLVPGGPGAPAGGAARSGTAQSAAARQRDDAELKKVEAEVKVGFEMYQRNEMDKGVEHFAKVLKQAYALPLTGMAVSVIFTASHAHIEGCAQLRRIGKAENTVQKLKELAEYADTHEIPFAIPTLPDRLHLWWREKRANLYSRERQFSKAAEVHMGALPHAAKIAPRFEAGVLVLLCSSQVDLYLMGSGAFSPAKLQEHVDAGLKALKADPPPAGGGGAAASNWPGEAKLEQWARLLPMLGNLETEGVDARAARSTIAPLAQKFGIEVGQGGETPEMFVGLNMAPKPGGVMGVLSQLNAMTVLFGLALLLPVALGVYLAVRTALMPDVEEEAAPDAAGAGSGEQPFGTEAP